MSLAEASHERAAAATGLLVARLTRTLTADGGGGGSGGCGVPCAAAVAAPAEEAPQLAAEAPAAAQPPPPPTLRVIGAGLGRTGTLSTKVALETLLGGPARSLLRSHS